jgi:hypothetical protein
MPVEAAVMGTSIYCQAPIPLVNIDRVLREKQNTLNVAFLQCSIFSTN